MYRVVGHPTEQLQLPTVDPESHAAKMEKNHFNSAETAVHIIPLMLLLCAVILWVFSGPAR
ncbi:hypothetical protein F511_22944 [Dorcoceras hygrometricum]|uniref:Uncharacterized protein n=1 Tax=Dorcoceras hygrometricum TaxID=472368 RepID=A0A2Z7BK55_9LAMI|nr:hypothetical protein F511_22944 [Dorcoceras hygrometricum]